VPEVVPFSSQTRATGGKRVIHIGLSDKNSVSIKEPSKLQCDKELQSYFIAHLKQTMM
jgi:hypothetical protein